MAVQRIDWSELRLEIDGRPLIEPCFAFELCTLRHEGLLDFYEAARRALAGLLTHYQTDSMERRRRLDARAETIVPTWLKRPRPGHMYWAKLSGCDEGRGVTPASLEASLFATPPSERSEEEAEKRRANNRKLYAEGITPSAAVMIVRATVPSEHELAVPGQALQWLLEREAVRSYPFVSGHAGYAVNVDAAASEAARDRFRSLLLRYPGLDCNQHGALWTGLLRYDPETGDFVRLVKRANWLNLTAESTVDHLGGREELRRALGEDLEIVVHELPYGLMIQAGPAPRLGDIARRDFLPEYRRAAKVLRPVRLETIGIGEGIFREEVASDWLNAFDREYD